MENIRLPTSYDATRIFRRIKSAVYNYSDLEIKVRDATSNDPWGASSTLMQELSSATFSTNGADEIMNMILMRMQETSSKDQWRPIYKSLLLTEYLICNGSENIVSIVQKHRSLFENYQYFEYYEIPKEGEESASTFSALNDLNCKISKFIFPTDDDQEFKKKRESGIDRGVNVRKKLEAILELIDSPDHLNQLRNVASSTKNKYKGHSHEIATSSGGTHVLRRPDHFTKIKEPAPIKSEPNLLDFDQEPIYVSTHSQPVIEDGFSDFVSSSNSTPFNSWSTNANSNLSSKPSKVPPTTTTSLLDLDL